jgi:predicted nucleic acid-binding protein
MIFLDTNVISETMKPKPDRLVLHWIERNGPSLHLSTVVLAEILFGIHKIRSSGRPLRWKQAITRWRRQLNHRIAAFDADSADLYGQMMGAAKLRGATLDIADGMIAAIALRHKAALATRNTRHFEGLGLTIVDPWQA